MKKIIIVGHPDSHYQEVEKIFQMHGMAPALPSKREQMTPIEIGKVLSKAQIKIPPVEQVSPSLLSSSTTRKAKRNKKHKSNTNRHIPQALSTTPLTNMWDALPMDLMLANLDQDFWGWADPQAIELLDYWANIDPSIHFVFIYDKPQNIFQHSSLEEALALDADKVQSKLESWQEYNQKVLEYFNKYQARSVLISSQRVQETILQSTSEIYKQIAVPRKIIDRLEKEQHNQEIEDAQITNEAMLSKECALSSLIVDNIMQDNQPVLSLYDELQDQANFPYITHLLPNQGATQALNAWKEMIHQQMEIKQQLEKNQQIQSEKEDLTVLLKQQVQDLQHFEKELKDSQQKGSNLEKQNTDLNTQKKELETKNMELKSQAADLEKKKSSLENIKSELEKKNSALEKQAKQAKDEVKNTQVQLLTLESETKALMTQLNVSQEEFERLLNKQNADFEKKQATLQTQKTELEKSQVALKTQNSELQNKKAELEKQAKKAEDDVKSAQKQLLSLEDENKALMTQLNFTQEELERLFLANQKLQEQPPLWGAADRIRNQLTYRIGYKLQQHGKSPVGWIKMPFVLYSTYRQYSKDKKKNEWHKLPPIHLYKDAYEAEKVKNHLSYKLGEIFMKDIINPFKWLMIPSKLIKEGNKFNNNNKG